MKKIKALIYAILGGMVCWSWWQRGSPGMAIFIGLFTVGIVGLTLSTLGQMTIAWDDEVITISKFPNKQKVIAWRELEKIKLDHLGYHIKASSGSFKIGKQTMPANLLKRIRDSIKENKA